MFEVIELGGNKTVTAQQKAACNHVYVVDVSGSMYNDLPKIRQHLKNIITVVAQPDDTFSVIYFSGRGQCGVVFENVLVSDASTVQMMHDSIDRFIQTIGLTGFVDPIKKAMGLNLDPSKLNNFIMLTDGYDNQSSRADIIKETGLLKTKFQSVSFLEYGYYADRELLAAMASEVNGIHVFSEGYEKYEEAMNEMISGVPRVQNMTVKVNKKAKHAAFIYQGQIRIVNAVDGEVVVPEDVDRVHSIVPGDVLSKQLSVEHLYLILYYASKTNNAPLVWNALEALGDVRLVEAFQNAFTKQEISAFEDLVGEAVLNEDMRFVDGRDLTIVPKKDAPTIIDLLRLLSEAEGSMLVTDSPYWSYNRIGRASVKADGEVLPRFVQSPMARLSMRGLVFNSERPNVSISTQVAGNVMLPENDFGLSRVPSFITRNYTIIRDGIRNMDELPVLFKKELAPQVEGFAHEVVDEGAEYFYWVFNLKKIPVINRQMVESVDLGEFKDSVLILTRLKSDLKVLNAKVKEDGDTSKTVGLIEKYGDEAAAWLSSIGVRDYGFGEVGTKSTEVTDEYESIQVLYKIKGLSSLPAIDATLKKQSDGKKLNAADRMILDSITWFNGLKDPVEGRDKLTKQKRAAEVILAKMIYALVLGKVWFGDEEVVTTDLPLFSDLDTPMTIEKVRKMIKI